MDVIGTGVLMGIGFWIGTFLILLFFTVVTIITTAIIALLDKLLKKTGH